MIDLINTLRGRRQCPWCVDRPTNWLDRFMGGDELVPHAERPWYERAYWSIQDFWTMTLPIWKVGHALHCRRHGDEP